jgi:dolichyl-diphosphooligosaccharide--protein glycosyltransferase
LQIVAFVEFIRGHVGRNQFNALFKAIVVGVFLLSFGALVFLTLSGYIAPWTGRFYSLWDTDYARKYIPIIASVSEHQPTPWVSFFFDMQILIFLFPAGIFLCFKKLENEHVFLILYGVTASYFAGVMVRLILTLTPVVCVTAAIAISSLFDVFLDDYNEEAGDKTAVTESASPTSPDVSASKKLKGSQGKLNEEDKKVKASQAKSEDNKAIKQTFKIYNMDSRYIVVFPVLYMLLVFGWHCTWVTSNAYSSPSVVLASYKPDGSRFLIDDYREAYHWLRENTAEDAKVMSWWDYGYQIAGLANRTTLVDNNTWNNSHIATVGMAMSSNEEVSYEIMRRHDVDYVLVIFGGLLGYSGDDINKFLWMIRISSGVYPTAPKEPDFFTPRGEYRVDNEASKTMKESMMYKMSFYRYNQLFPGGQAVDRVRGQNIPNKDIKLDVIEEVFTSENWIVRIYKVKDLDNLGRHMISSKRPRRKKGNPRAVRGF